MPVSVRTLPPSSFSPVRHLEFRLAVVGARLLRFHVMNAIIAYLPSGDKKVIIPSAPAVISLSLAHACRPGAAIPYPLHRHQSELLLNNGRGGNYAIMRK